MTTFDRYIMARFAHVFGVFFVVTYGLFVVFDCFTNVDAFQQGSDSGLEVLRQIVIYYGWHMFDFFELVGTMLAIISAVVTLAILHKQSEVHPILAAGIPTFRLAKPLLVATFLVNLMLIGNQEIVVPAIAERLQAPRGSGDSHWQRVEPIYDKNMINIDGRRLYLATRRLNEATFTIRPPRYVHELTTIRASDAVYHPRRGKRPGGWLLSGISRDFNPDVLTDASREFIIPIGDSGEIFIRSSVSFDQLSNRGQSYKLISSDQIVDRIRNASTGLIPSRAQEVHLHHRITRPLASLGMVYLVIPLVIRRESTSLIGNMAVCSGVLIILYGVSLGVLYLGGTSYLDPDLAAWLPVMATGGSAAWFSTWVQT